MKNFTIIENKQKETLLTSDKKLKPLEIDTCKQLVNYFKPAKKRKITVLKNSNIEARTQIISKFQAYDLIKASKKIFSVLFIKKDKSMRKMICRLGVTKHLKGGVKAYNAIEYSLITVFDMKKKAYRSINLNTLKAIKLNKKAYLVKD